MKVGNTHFLVVLFLFHFSCKNEQSTSKSLEGKESIEVKYTSTSAEGSNNSDLEPSENTGLEKKGQRDNVNPKISDVNNAKNQIPKDTDSEKQIIKPAIPPDKQESMSDDQKEKQSDKINQPPIPQPEKIIKADYEVYQNLLQKYVNNSGRVNYVGLKKEVNKLEEYAFSLSDDPTFEKGTEKEKLALWINTYNVYTLLMVARNYPLRSIRDLHSGKPWDASWIRIGKKTYSLNQIENDIIRPQFNEPRVHFLLNCAAISCPPLINKAITADNLEKKLETATQNFIKSRENNIQENVVEISSIFDWYRQDFGDVLSFLSKYSGIRIKSNAKITYKNYNWSLNEM